MRRRGLPLVLAVACSPGQRELVAAHTELDAEAPVASVVGPAVHGTLRDEHGTPVLRVWGTPREMGHAHGVLLRAQILAVIDGYALDAVPPATLAAAGAVLERAATVAPSLREEAEGVIEGMRVAGGAHVPRLDRELTVADLLALNAMTDLVAVGCSSVSAWDGALEGAQGPWVARNLDWSDDPELLAHQLVIVTMPVDPTRQPLVSVGFAGYIACLSCINEAGVTALFNMGHGAGVASPTAMLAGFSPANLLLRDALERRDVDGDGRSRADDVEAAIRAARHVGSYIVHVVEPVAGGEVPARVLEVESNGVATRRPSVDDLGAQRLAATNHLRAKTEPRACSRYQRVQRAARRDAAFSGDELWSLLRSLRLEEVVHTLRVDVATRGLTVWLRAPGEPSDASTPGVRHRWEALLRREP